MKFYLKIVFVLSYLLLFCSSCASSKKKYEENYYKVTNLIINKAAETKDSVKVFSEFSKEHLAEYNKNKLHELHYIARYKEETVREIYYTNFILFLAKRGIDFDKELLYFKKQLDRPIHLNTDKIELKEFQVVPRNSKNLKLYSNYDFIFRKNFFSYSRPVFTKNGQYAIAHYKYSSRYYFIIFKRKGTKWIEVDKYPSSGKAHFD